VPRLPLEKRSHMRHLCEMYWTIRACRIRSAAHIANCPRDHLSVCLRASVGSAFTVPHSTQRYVVVRGVARSAFIGMLQTGQRAKGKAPDV